MLNSPAVKEWISWDQTHGTDISKMSEPTLQKIFKSRMAFGTAGLRSTMGPGPSQMNDLTIIQTSQGLLKYAENHFGLQQLQEKGIVVGYDARYNSKNWAAILANIAKSMGVKVKTFRKVTPTPWVAFGIRKFGAALGVMITASHNPKNDNGYKVYWNNGSQIIPPHDKKIAASILENLKPWSDECWNKTLNFSSESLISDILDENSAAYFEVLKRYVSFEKENQESDMKMVYTPVHGVGYDSCKHAILNVFKFKEENFSATPEQKYPDPDFPTVEFPNPEEGKGVLSLSFKEADRIGANLVLASDPDADRLAVAQRPDANSPWKVFTGNECGALLGYWAFEMWRKRNPEPASPKNCWMLSSTVSSMICKAIAEKEGFNFEDTLTGFKWMGNSADRLINDNQQVLFAFEEAIGFMYGDQVLDKDGVSACAIFAEFCAQLDKENKTLVQKLDEIYQKYGYHVAENSYFISHDKEKTNAMFKVLQDNYPKKLGNDYEIVGVRDLNKGFDSRQPDKKAVLPTQSSHMITFYFSNGATITLRTSGTEPKIKYYVEMVADSREKVLADIEKMVDLMVKEWYQPEKYGFISRYTE